MSKLIVISLVLGLGIAGMQAIHAREKQILLDRIVAVVENDAIMSSELLHRIQMVKRQLTDRQGPQPPPEVLKKQVLEHLIVERLQLQLAERQGIRIDDLTLNETMRNIAGRNGVSLEQFRDQLVTEGIDYVNFREQVRIEMIIDSLRKRMVDRKVQITDQEIADLISSRRGGDDGDLEYRLNHILIAVPEAANADDIKAARVKAESIRARALKGEDFRQLAISESDGQKALEGGDLDWRKSNQMPSIFARSVPTMKVGDISEIIRSPSGFHIIYLADRRGQEQKLVSQTRVRHILFKTSALLDDEQARLRLKELKQRIKLGEDFSVLAKSHSEDTGSAIEGGDLGWTSPGDLVPEFEEVMNSLEVGMVSEPFKSSYGWHIVEVIERRNYDNTEEALRAQARDIIFKRKIEEETELWLRRLRDESYVEYRLEPQDGG